MITSRVKLFQCADNDPDGGSLGQVSQLKREKIIYISLISNIIIIIKIRMMVMVKWWLGWMVAIQTMARDFHRV